MQYRFHYLFAVNKSSSGILAKVWMDRLIKVHEIVGSTSGPAVCDKNGVVMETNKLDNLFQYILLEIWLEKPSLFPKKIKNEEDVQN